MQQSVARITRVSPLNSMAHIRSVLEYRLIMLYNLMIIKCFIDEQQRPRGHLRHAAAYNEVRTCSEQPRRDYLLRLLPTSGDIRALRRPAPSRTLPPLRRKAPLARAVPARARHGRAAACGWGPGARDRSVSFQRRSCHRQRPVRAGALRRGGRAAAAPPPAPRRGRPVRSGGRGNARIRRRELRLHPVQQHASLHSRGSPGPRRDCALPEAGGARDDRHPSRHRRDPRRGRAPPGAPRARRGLVRRER